MFMDTDATDRIGHDIMPPTFYDLTGRTIQRSLVQNPVKATLFFCVSYMNSNVISKFHLAHQNLQYVNSRSSYFIDKTGKSAWEMCENAWATQYHCTILGKSVYLSWQKSSNSKVTQVHSEDHDTSPPSNTFDNKLQQCVVCATYRKL
jgi:hypothetical protein